MIQKVVRALFLIPILLTLFATGISKANNDLAKQKVGMTPCESGNYKFNLPDPVPDGYHFYCKYEEPANSSPSPLILWNHDVFIKGFVMDFIVYQWKGIYTSDTEKINKVYFTAKHDRPHEVPPYVCVSPGLPHSRQAKELNSLVTHG